MDKRSDRSDTAEFDLNTHIENLCSLSGVFYCVRVKIDCSSSVLKNQESLVWKSVHQGVFMLGGGI